MKQSGSLVKTASPIHCIVSQILFCVEQNCFVVYGIVMTFALGPVFLLWHKLMCISVPQINLVLEGLN